MNTIKIGASILALAFAAGGIQPALALPEAMTAPIGSLKCSDIAGLPPAHAAALVYFAAGYQEGLRASSTEATQPAADTGTTDTMASDADAKAAADMKTDTNADANAAAGADTTAQSEQSANSMIGGLGLQADAIISACTNSADKMLVDIITENGGAAGMPTTDAGMTKAPDAGSDQSTEMKSTDTDTTTTESK